MEVQTSLGAAALLCSSAQQQEVLSRLALKSSCLLLAMSRPGLLGSPQEAAASWLVLGSTFLQEHRGLSVFRCFLPCSTCLPERCLDVQHLTGCA